MTVVQRKSPSADKENNSRHISPVLRRTQLAKFVSEVQLKDLESYCRTLSRSSGHTLFRQGDEPNSLYLVMRGTVELRARPPGRRVYRTVEVVGEGCTVGDEAVVGEPHYFSSARVQEAARLLVLTRPDFERLSESRPDIAIAVLKCAGSCLIQTVRRAAILTQAPAEVALELILQELSSYANENGKQGPVRITHAQLAGLLHLSRETVSRMLGQMASQGLVELSRGTIRIRPQ